MSWCLELESIRDLVLGSWRRRLFVGPHRMMVEGLRRRMWCMEVFECLSFWGWEMKKYWVKYWYQATSFDLDCFSGLTVEEMDAQSHLYTLHRSPYLHCNTISQHGLRSPSNSSISRFWEVLKQHLEPPFVVWGTSVWWLIKTSRSKIAKSHFRENAFWCIYYINRFKF